MILKTQYTKKVNSFLEENIKNQRMSLDSNRKKLTKIYKKYAENFLLKLAIKKEYGGTEISRAEEVQTKILLCEYNFSLNWLISLLHAAYLLFEKIKDPLKKEKLVKGIVDNKDTFSYYAITGESKKNLKLGKNKKGEWIVNGEIPWLTGYKICKYALVPAMNNNKQYYIKIDFKSQGSRLKVNLVNSSFVNTLGVVNLKFKNFPIIDSINLLEYDSEKNVSDLAHPSAYYFVGFAHKINYLINSDKKLLNFATTRTLKELTTKLKILENKFIKNPLQKKSDFPKTESSVLALQFLELYRAILQGKSLLKDTHFTDCFNQYTIYQNLGDNINDVEHLLKQYLTWK